MSLLAGRRKKKQKTVLPRRFDTKYMGEEPTWETLPTDPVERRITVMKALNWYNYMKTSCKDAIPYLIQYASDHRGWSKDDVKLIKWAPDNLWDTSVESYVRMYLNGYPWLDRERDRVNAEFDRMLAKLTKLKANELAEKQAAPIVYSPAQCRMSIELDEIEDAWLDGDRKIEYNLYERQQALNENKGDLEKYVRPWIKRRLDDMIAHRDGDEDIKEGYNISSRERNRRIKAYEAWLSDLDMITATKTKKPRKVRAKKAVTADKQAQGFKYLKESTEFKLKSLEPIEIIGAERIFLFDVQHRKLTELVALPGGFGGKGMAITNFDSMQSRSVRLRKPEEILPSVLTDSKTKIHKAWNALTTKTGDTNGRLNRNTIIVRKMK